MDCPECDRLRANISHRLRSYQEQQYVNRTMGLSRTKGAKSGEQGLKDAYVLAGTELKFHLAKEHADEEHTVTMEDMNIIVRKGRTKP
jgi:hypothetical protein